MALVTASDVISLLKLPDEVEDKLAPWIPQADAKLLDLVGQENYDDIDALPGANQDRQRADLAESLLTVFYALPHLNIRLTTQGGLVKAIGFEASRTEIMGKGELERLRGSYYSQAINLLGEYVIDEQDASDNYTGFTGPGFSFDAVSSDA